MYPQHSIRQHRNLASVISVAFWMALLIVAAGCDVMPAVDVANTGPARRDAAESLLPPAQSGSDQSSSPDGANGGESDVGSNNGSSTEQDQGSIDQPEQNQTPSPNGNSGESENHSPEADAPVGDKPDNMRREDPPQAPDASTDQSAPELAMPEPEGGTVEPEMPESNPPSGQLPEAHQPEGEPPLNPVEPPSNPIEPPANPVEPPASQPVSPPSGGEGQSGNNPDPNVQTPPDGSGQNPPPPPPESPPLAQMPAPRRAFLGYIPDGGYQVADGVGAAPLRNIAVTAMPRLARYGFGRYVSPSYLGIARSEADARTYFAPLVAAARANGMDYVPGFFLHHIVDSLYGVPWGEPWNVTGPECDLRHPMNPGAVVEPRFWDEVVLRALNLARGAESRQVYIDAEFVFWMHRHSPVWTDENLAIIKPLARDAVRRLREQGVFLTMYHPHVHPNVPEILRIALGVFGPESADDPLSFVEHFAPAPFYNTTRYVIPGPASIANEFVSRGFQDNQIRFGFISNHAFEGFSPAAYDAYCNDRPGTAERSWYFTTSGANDRISREFDALVADNTTN